jgi:hypothetical protein
MGLLVSYYLGCLTILVRDLGVIFFCRSPTHMNILANTFYIIIQIQSKILSFNEINYKLFIVYLLFIIYYD